MYVVQVKLNARGHIMKNKKNHTVRTVPKS